MAYEGHRYGKSTVGDGGTITHNLGKVPVVINLTGSVAGSIVTATSATSTTMVVAVKTVSVGAIGAGVSQTVYWEVAY